MQATDVSHEYFASGCALGPVSPQAATGRLARRPAERASRRENARRQRIRSVFGLAGDARLPEVDEASLSTYCGQLLGALSLPFEALYFDESCPSDDCERTITVVDLLDPGDHPAEYSQGILCLAMMEGRPTLVPLAEISLKRDSVNIRQVEDYWHWFWNLA